RSISHLQRTSKRGQRVQRRGFTLQDVHQERPAGQRPVTCQDVRDATHVTGDDVVLLPGEGPEVGSFQPPGLEPFQVRMAENPLIERLEIASDVIHELTSVHHRARPYTSTAISGPVTRMP